MLLMVFSTAFLRDSFSNSKDSSEVNFIVSEIIFAMALNPSWHNPNVVMAGVPKRIPEVMKGLKVSPGTVFLLHTMFISPKLY